MGRPRWTSVSRCPSLRTASAPCHNKLGELAYVADELRDVLRPEDANLWICGPNRLLDGDTPAHRISAGDFRSVVGVIEALADGIVV